MMETMMVALIFIVLLLVALAFLFKFQLESVEEKGDRACIVSNTVLLSTVAAMPEIQCSFDSKAESCIDTTKLLVFNPQREYGSLFTTNCKQRVYFTQYSPEVQERECEPNTYPDCSTYTFFDPQVGQIGSVIKLSTPMSLYHPLTDEYTFGELTIEVLQ